MMTVPVRSLAEGAVASLADGLAVVDALGRVAFWNPRAEQIFGLGAAEVLYATDRNLYDAIAERTGDAGGFLDKANAAATSAHSMTTFEFTTRHPQERAIEAQWFELREEGRALGYGVLFRDVTREKELDQMKNQLISTVSHELRTPLAAIKGFTTTLLREDVRWDEATQRDFLKIIEEETDRLGELIDNLLDLSQIEAGALRVRQESVQLRNLVREAVEGVQPRTETHWFVVDLPGELPRVWADPRRIRQVLHNLLENAVKYSPRGGQITVACEVEGDHVTVSVADSGQGIPAQYVDKIFERFFQVDGASTRKTGGSGLGLSISKGIIQAHGGKIWAESTEGQGSVFRFTLPIASEANLAADE